jgi:hypothetical protein
MDTLMLMVIFGLVLLTFALIFCAISLSIKSAAEFARRRLLGEREVERTAVPRRSLMSPAPARQSAQIRQTPTVTR